MSKSYLFILWLYLNLNIVVIAMGEQLFVQIKIPQHYLAPFRLLLTLLILLKTPSLVLILTSVEISRNSKVWCWTKIKSIRLIPIPSILAKNSRNSL